MHNVDVFNCSSHCKILQTGKHAAMGSQYISAILLTFVVYKQIRHNISCPHNAFLHRVLFTLHPFLYLIILTASLLANIAVIPALSSEKRSLWV